MDNLLSSVERKLFFTFQLFDKDFGELVAGHRVLSGDEFPILDHADLLNAFDEISTGFAEISGIQEI
jgi:hypothetical protein